MDDTKSSIIILHAVAIGIRDFIQKKNVFRLKTVAGDSYIISGK